MSERETENRLTAQIVLGSTLRCLRERQGLSLREVASKVQFNHSYIGRVETGQQLPSDVLFRALCDLYDERELLVGLFDLAREGSIKGYGRETAKREQNAARIEVFTSSTFPGLLQTEPYMRALFTSGNPRRPQQDLENAITARLARKQLLERNEPTLFWSLLDEAVLKRPVGSDVVMRDQIESLLAASESPYITVQVLPYDAGSYGMMGGSLTLMTMQDGESVAYVESFANGELVELPRKVLHLRQLYDLARGNSLTESDSRKLIEEYRKGYE